MQRSSADSPDRDCRAHARQTSAERKRHYRLATAAQQRQIWPQNLDWDFEIMRLYGAIEKVETRDDGTVRVYGIATSEAADEQGEIVRAAAMRAAIPDYMRFPTLREMHQLSAAGTTLEAEVEDDGTTRIVAHVVDPVAVTKVKNHVYRGFSIGGRVTQRDVSNPKVITGLVLNEISLVDRPANPEAVFDCWKAAGEAGAFVDGAACSELREKRLISLPAAFPQEPFNSPIQIWACGIPDHRHLAKADAAKCLEERKNAPPEVATAGAPGMGERALAEKLTTATAADAKNALGLDVPDAGITYADPGYQPDGKKRYPIDSEPHIRAAWNFINKPRNAAKYTSYQLSRIRSAIIRAWKAKIDKDGPPGAEDGNKASRVAVAKTVSDVCSPVRNLTDLEWLRDQITLAATDENDDPLQRSRLSEAIAELCNVLNSLLTGEPLAPAGRVDADGQSAVTETAAVLAMGGGPSTPARLPAALGNGNSHTREATAAVLARASRLQADQMLLDLAYLACDKCLKTGGLSADESEHMGKAREHLLRAGAVSIPSSRPPRAEDDENSSADRSDADARREVATVLDVIGGWLSKWDRAAQHMMDMAHDCLRELTDGTMCGQAETIGARHSREAIRELKAAHRRLVAAGAACTGVASAAVEEMRPGTDVAISKRADLGEISKLLASEQAERIALAKVVSDIAPMIDRLTKRVEEIARTPLPALTMAKNTVSLSKQEDHSSGTVGGSAQLSQDAIASALAKMTTEEQTLTLIKASYANPIRAVRSSADE